MARSALLFLTVAGSQGDTCISHQREGESTVNKSVPRTCFPQISASWGHLGTLHGVYIFVHFKKWKTGGLGEIFRLWQFGENLVKSERALLLSRVAAFSHGEQ